MNQGLLLRSLGMILLILLAAPGWAQSRGAAARTGGHWRSGVPSRTVGAPSAGASSGITRSYVNGWNGNRNAGGNLNWGFAGPVVTTPPLFDSTVSINGRSFPGRHPGHNGHHDRNRFNGYGHDSVYGLPWYWYPYWDFGYEQDRQQPELQQPTVIYVPVNPPQQEPVRQQDSESYAQRSETPPSLSAPRDPHSEAPAPAPIPSQPTVLVFRDGRRQQVESYAIYGENLIELAPDRRKIALAELDLPATIRVNDEQGVTFDVPK